MSDSAYEGPALEIRAADFAATAHARVGQRRKYTNEPYIGHPAAVAELVRSVPHTYDMLAAAWLHDTVEDCGVTLAQIEREFGAYVRRLVESLTDVSKPSDGNRAARKRLDLEHVAQAWPDAKTVKLADIIDNSESILAHDKKFARVYLPEICALLQVLRAGDATLWARADEIVRRGILELGARELGQ